MKYLLSIISFTVLLSVADAQNKDLEKVRKRVRFELMQPKVDYEHIEELITTINKDGSWPGINYKDVSRTGFQHSQHLTNLIDLSHAYRKSHTRYYGDKKARKALKNALYFWFENDFICDNWWWNQIGTPDRMVSVLLIMDEELTEKERLLAAPIVGRANLDAWGARPGGDLIKIAGILGKYALFKKDEETFRTVVETIANEIGFAVERGTPQDTRGLQTDLSFHHRKDRVNNTLSYGLQFAAIFAEWAAKIGDTEFRFPDKQFQLLVDYYLDGICQMMVFGTFPDLGAKNRSITRSGTLRPQSTKVLKNLILAGGDYRTEELSKISQIRSRNEPPKLERSQFFWHSEYYSHQRPEYFSSVRMYSTRNRSMEEPYNGEGLFNHHLGEGSNFVYTTGVEYFDIFPLFDWQKIPGTTLVQRSALPPKDQVQQEGLSDFVGGVTDGEVGVATIDFKSPHYDLKAKKSWFFFEDEYVCLGAGISSDLEEPVFTTLNQTWLRGPVSVGLAGKARELEQGEHLLEKVDWIIHKDIGYFLPDRPTIGLRNQEESGSWFAINNQHDSPKKEEKGQVFAAWIDHGSKVANASYQYIVVPRIEEKGFEKYEKELPVQVLSNTPEIQSVISKESGISQTVFHQAGEINILEDLNIAVEQPCLIMLTQVEGDPNSLSVSDPSRKLAEVIIRINRQLSVNDSYEVSWDATEATSELIIQLPQADYPGQSRTVLLQTER